MDPFPFHVIHSLFPSNLPSVFSEVTKVTMFEEVCKGRLGAVLVDPS